MIFGLKSNSDTMTPVKLFHIMPTIYKRMCDMGPDLHILVPTNISISYVVLFGVHSLYKGR